MSRPPFSVTDDQVRELVQRGATLLGRYPFSWRDHRRYLRAVHEVNGKFYGPDLYRCPLRAYTLGGNPPKPTIAVKRDALERELAAGAATGSLSAAVGSRGK